MNFTYWFFFSFLSLGGSGHFFSNELLTSRLTFTFRQSLLILSSCPLALSPRSPPSAVTLVKIMEKNSPFTADCLLQGQASEELRTQKLFFSSYFAIFFIQIPSCSNEVVAYSSCGPCSNKCNKDLKSIFMFNFIHLAHCTMHSWSSHPHPVTPPD